MKFELSSRSMVRAFSAALVIFGASAAAQAATWTWDYTGLPGQVWATDGQWTTSGFPDFSADPGTEDLVFGDSTNTAVLLRDISNRDRIKSLTFTADAPAYTFSRDSYPTQHLVLSQDGILTNDSNDVQTFNSGLAIEPAYTVNANTGDSVSNYSFIVGDHLYLDTSGTTGPTYNGPYDMHVTGTGGGALQGATTGVVFTINNAKLLVDGGMNIRGTFTLNGTGQVIIKGAWAPASSSNTVKAGNGTLVLDGASTTTKTMTINAGIVRIGNDTALGATANTTTIGGGANEGRLELYNGINSAESIVLNGRANDAAPHISNYSGSNTLSGTITAGASQSGHYTIASASGSTLTLAGAIDQSNTGTQVLNLGGAGDIVLNGSVNGTWSKLAKQGGGTLTLGSSGTISAAAIDVQAGYLDVTALPGGLTLGYDQTLMGAGTVLGDVATSYGSTVAPGGSPGTLTVNGNLTLNGSDTLHFDLSNDPILGANDRIDLNKLSGVGGNLTLYGTTTLAVTAPDGLSEGVYRLVDYEGNLTGNAANFSIPGVGGTTRQSLTVLTGNDVGGTAHQVNLKVEGAPLHLTWSGNNPNHDWDVVGDSNWNSGSQKFYNQDFVTFNDTGSNASPVNIAEDVAPASLTVDNPTKDYIFSGPGRIRGSTGLTKDGAGKLTIMNSGTNDFTGTIAVGGGTLQVGSGGASGNLGGGDVTLGTNGTLIYKRSDDLSLFNNLHGSGNLRQEGTNVLTLSGANADYTGTITIASGTLKLGSAAALGDSTGGTVVADGGALDVNGVNVPAETLTVQGAGGGGGGALVNTNVARSDVNAVVLAGNTTVGGIGDIDRTQGVLNFAAMQGNGKDLVKVGSNTVQFDDAGETDLGNITVNEGNLFFYGTATLGDPTKTVTIANDAVLSFYNSPDPAHEKPIVIDSTGGKIANFRYNSTVDSPITMNGNLTLTSKQNTLRLAGTLTGNGNLDRNTFLAGTDTGTVYLLSDGNNYSGTTSITAGVLSVGDGGTTGSLGGTGDITLGDNGSLRYNRQGTNNISRNIVGTGLSSLAVGYGSGNSDFNDTVFNVSGNNTYTGDTWVYGGTVVLSSATGLGDVTGKTVIDNSTDVIACVALTGGIAVAENFEMQPRSTYAPHLQNLSGHNTLSGAIGTGTAGGAGTTTIRSEGTVPGDLLTISGNITCETAGVSLWLRGPGKGEVTGSIGESGGNWTSVNIADGGAWTLTNPSYYTGYTAVYDGALVLKDNGSIPSTPAVILYGDSATLQVTDLTNPTFTVPSTMWLVGHGTVAGNLESSYGTISPSGPVSPSLNLTANTNLPIGTMNVGGNLKLSGYDYLQFKLGGTGGTQNDQIQVTGALQTVDSYSSYVSIIPSGPITPGTYTLISAASQTGLGTFALDTYHPHNTRYGLTLNNSTPGQLKVTVSGSNDTITWSGPSGGTWDVITSANWTGPHDSLFWQGDAVEFTGETEDMEIVVGDAYTNQALYPASILVSSSKNYTFSGAGKISSGAGITKSGSGTLTIANTGANDYTGTVTITGGTLKPAGAYALGSDAGGTVVNGGTLDLNGYYNFRQEPISVQGAGADGNTGALVNNNADQTPYVEPSLYYVTLTGDATIGGTHSWSIQGNVPAYSGWSAGYLHGNGHDLTKVGTTEIALADLGATNLGNVNVNEGTLTVSGNTDLGTSALNLSGGAALKLSDATATVQKTLNVASTGGAINNSSGDSTIAGSGGTLDGLLTVQTAAETTLTLANALDGTGGLSKDNDGTLILSGANTYEGDTTISGGVLELVTGGQIGVASLITNQADLVVSSGNHTSGVIEGTGTTTVLDSASLTVTSITQSTLVIGGSGAPSPSMAPAPVPEPGTWLLLLLGLFGIAGRQMIRIRRYN